ncbi:serine hydrolase [Streptomyces lavenduligriseus]|uniref:Class A beta-lactamase-related serine hydrolase n=1 Tax=Streptomyces lavenduligriseus TaxID=67315 RepID=A0ABT0P2K9_9ACTN|nr:serine hydrolase [Streptomyces lavenduligriseus]MCL3997840.1 class A beta-lactamase-related serine hydrolase [Streptomyces lavenduligriseus]
MPIRPSHTARTTAGALVTAAVALSAAALPHPAAAAAPPAPSGKARAHATAAVLDLDGTGRTAVLRGADRAYDTASIVKVDILAALLLRAQDAGRPLSEAERDLAEPMIRRSDNAAANALWRRIGRASGLAAANERLGLTSTTGGPGGKWGLTRTTASDQIRLLRAVFDSGGTVRRGSGGLDAGSRAYVRTLMSRVESGQSWGVSAAGSPGARPALKNGWLQRSTTGRWDVNSVGEIAVRGHRYLVAVLSDGNASMGDGVSLVERTARAAV